MDFKSLMSSQISKSKAPTTSTTSTSKYQRRADLEAQRQATYAAEQAQIQSEREERATKKRKLEEEDAEKNAEREAKLQRLAAESKIRREERERDEEKARRTRLGLPGLIESTDETTRNEAAEDEQEIEDDELRVKLRDLKEPITLYSETHTGRLKRYYKLTRPTQQLSTGPIPTTLSLVEEKDMLLPSPLPPQGTPEHTLLYRQLASYFTLLLSEWSRDLSSRSPEVKDSSTGRAALQSHLNVIRELTPLFRLLESSTLSPSLPTLPATLLNPLCTITHHAQSRRYVKANDAYLTLSIGKAAWPIGVTMVGIHERSARENLGEGKGKANIMADEVTRKWLQSVKRCLSYAQVRWPPEDVGELMG